jgi:hypothetical protein
MGAYICTLSEHDWNITRTKGIYGNRYFKEDTANPFGDVAQLSIIRDLISMRDGDVAFFHIRRAQRIQGVYRIRSEPFFEETEIWANPIDKYPYRFLIEPHPQHLRLSQWDAHISVSSLYEHIDRGHLKSLATLENEQNIEARGVRRILDSDAANLIRLLHRDFRWKRSTQATPFNLYQPTPAAVPLKDRVFKVGNIENAIKAIIVYDLAHANPAVLKLFAVPEGFDFANEFFVAPTTRKAFDILVTGKSAQSIIEVKTDMIESGALQQALYYRDVLRQRPWISHEDRITVALVGQHFRPEVKAAVRRLNQMRPDIRLVAYRPNAHRTWATFQDETPPNN